MKFLRQNQKPRLCKKLSLPIDTQNTHNQKQNLSHTQDKPSQTSMEDEALQHSIKEEQVYQSEIIGHLLARSLPLSINPHYFATQPDITEHMRAVLLNWLIEVHLKYRFQPQTLFACVHLIDIFLSRKVVYRNELQLVGITALWICAKFEETYCVPKLQTLGIICDNAYTKEDILRMESNIIEAVGFSLLQVTALDYLKCLDQQISLSPKDYFLCLYLLEISLYSVSFAKYKPQQVAAASFFFVAKLRKREKCWSEKLAALFHFSQEQLKPCARELCSIWHQVEQIENTSNLRSKYLRRQCMEVGKIKIGPVRN